MLDRYEGYPKLERIIKSCNKTRWYCDIVLLTMCTDIFIEGSIIFGTYYTGEVIAFYPAL